MPTTTPIIPPIAKSTRPPMMGISPIPRSKLVASSAFLIDEAVVVTISPQESITTPKILLSKTVLLALSSVMSPEEARKLRAIFKNRNIKSIIKPAIA